MKKLGALCVCFMIISYTAVAQSKATISSLGAKLDSTLNAQTQLDDMGLSVIFSIQGIQYANTVTIGVGSVSIVTDGINTIFEVVRDGKMYYLVEQNMRFKVDNGTVTVFIHLNGKPEDYLSKYAIVRITDKEGHSSEPQSVRIR